MSESEKAVDQTWLMQELWNELKTIRSEVATLKGNQANRRETDSTGTIQFGPGLKTSTPEPADPGHPTGEPITSGDRGGISRLWVASRDLPPVLTLDNAREVLPQIQLQGRINNWTEVEMCQCVEELATPALRILLPKRGETISWAEIERRLLQTGPTTETWLDFELGQMNQKNGESPTAWLIRVQEKVINYLKEGEERDRCVHHAFLRGLDPRYHAQLGRCEFKDPIAVLERCREIDDRRGQTITQPPRSLLPTVRGQNNYNMSKSFFGNFNVNYDEFLFKTVTLDDRTLCKALIDTGTCLTLLSSNKRPRAAKTKVSEVRLKGITGQTINNPPVWRTSIEIDQKCVETDVYIVPDLGVDMILGLRTLRELGDSVDLVNQIIRKKIEGNKLAMIGVDEPENIETLKRCFPKVFAKSDFDLGVCKVATHHIRTTGEPFKRMYRTVPQALQKELDDQIKAMLRAGVIKHSHSPFASPALLVPKKDGTYRVCVDYRQLNSMTTADAYPTPRPLEVVMRMKGATVFSTLDLQAGYWQIPVAPEDRGKTAFTTPMGLFEFVNMPFGLNTAPATFQRTMDTIFGNPPLPFMCVYMDDILVFSQSIEEHRQHLAEVFNRLEAAGLKLKPSKCNLFQDRVTYVGHDISKAGIQVATDKFEKIKNFPQPLSTKGVKQFLGFVGYYRNHIPNFAQIAEPLNALSRKRARFIWSTECQEAFDKLRIELLGSSALAYPDFNQPFHLKTDASDVAIGVVLEQFKDEEPVAVNFASRTLTTAERNYTTTEKEALAIVWGVKTFKDYLWGRHFTIWTDHNPLTYLSFNRDAHGRLTRWYLTLQEYDFDCHHIPGKKNKVADALSRQKDQPEPVYVAGIIAQFDSTLIERFRQETRREGRLHPDMGGKLPGNKYEVKNDLLYRILETPEDEVVTQLYVPEALRQEILRQMHDECGHFGFQKTFELVRDRFYWPGYELAVKKYVRTCEICQRADPGRSGNIDLVSMMPEGPNQLIEWDLTGPFRDEDETPWYILVMIDTYTKWVEVCPVQDISSDGLATCFKREWVDRYGVPKQLHNDQGANFGGPEIQEMCKNLGIRHTRTSAYNPQGNGAVERFNRTLKDRLRRAPRIHWRKILSEMVRAYRMTVHSTTKVTPFESQFHRQPMLPIDRLTLNTDREKKEPRIVQRPGVKPKEVEPVRNPIKEGEQVLVRVEPRGSKLSFYWRGPVTVIGIPSKNAIKVRANNGNTWIVNRRKVKPYQFRPQRWVHQQPNDRACQLPPVTRRGRPVKTPSRFQEDVDDISWNEDSQDTLPMCDETIDTYSNNFFIRTGGSWPNRNNSQFRPWNRGRFPQPSPWARGQGPNERRWNREETNN